MLGVIGGLVEYLLACLANRRHLPPGCSIVLGLGLLLELQERTVFLRRISSSESIFKGRINESMGSPLNLAKLGMVSGLLQGHW